MNYGNILKIAVSVNGMQILVLGLLILIDVNLKAHILERLLTQYFQMFWEKIKILRRFVMMTKKYKILDTLEPSKPVVLFLTLKEILKEINRDHDSDTWVDYDETDWEEGLREIVYYWEILKD